MPRGFSIAIDGPVASGKGTLAASLARELNGFSVNTGAMYRALALYCIENNVDLKNESGIIPILPQVNITLTENDVFLNGVSVVERIKEPDVAQSSSIVASYSGVRKDLASRQQMIGKKAIEEGKIVIMEGRDIGIRVIPDADLKIFLTADSQVRAKRRLKQYEDKGIEKNFEDVLEETKARDELDTTRETDPLPKNPEELGYFVLNDSEQTENQTIDTVIQELKKRKLLQ